MDPVVAALLLAAQPVPSIDFTLPGQVRAAPPAPVAIPADAEILPFGTTATAARPSPAARHFLLDGAPAVARGGIPFTVRCLVERTNGRVAQCQAPSAPAAWRETATALASLYQFRLTPAQAQGTRALAVTIADRLQPSDVRPPATLFAFTTRPTAPVVFAQGVTAEQSQAYYPRSALQTGTAARIRLDCRVEPDLSIFCLDPTPAPGVDPGPHLAGFQLAALQLSSFLRAAPQLQNGAPAPGTVFRTTITFQVPD